MLRLKTVLWEFVLILNLVLRFAFSQLKVLISDKGETILLIFKCRISN